MLWQDVCLSVCLSHAGILSKWLDKSSKFFSMSGSLAILLFYHTKRVGNILAETPLTRGSNAKGYEIITNFDQYVALSRKRCKIEP